MPRLKRRGKSKNNITSSHLAQLAWGYDFFKQAWLRHGDDVDANTLEEMRAAWDTYKAKIMREWFKDRWHAGRRPWAWWKFEADMPQPHDVHNPKQARTEERAYLEQHDLIGADEALQLQRNDENTSQRAETKE